MTDKIDIEVYNKVVEENTTLKKTIEELEEKLKTYTNNHRHKNNLKINLKFH